MTARVIAVGHVKPEHGTLTVRFATGEPIWTPLAVETDDDLDLYKEDLESQIAWGGDL